MKCSYRIVLLVVFLSVFGCASHKEKSAETPAPVPTLNPESTETAAPTPSVAPNANSKVQCVAAEDKRTIEIDRADDKGCRLLYSNFSDKDAVAWSIKGPTHCVNVRDQIKTTLEGAGFKCEGV
jgi:hypothetical protein